MLFQGDVIGLVQYNIARAIQLEEDRIIFEALGLSEEHMILGEEQIRDYYILYISGAGNVVGDEMEIEHNRNGYRKTIEFVGGRLKM